MGPVLQSPHPHPLHLAVVAVIAGTALVSLREQEENIKKIIPDTMISAPLNVSWHKISNFYIIISISIQI